MNKELEKKIKNHELRSKYNHLFFCLDIETSTVWGINSRGERVKCSFVTSCAVSQLNYFTHEIKRVKLCRTYKDIDEFLYALNEKYKGKKTIVYIQNMSYEFSFFKNNLEFFKNETKQQMYVRNHTPLHILAGNLIFRCSYQLTSLSVEDMGLKITISTGEEMNKLDYDYDKIRTPLMELDHEEIEYNYRDCDIVLKYLDLFIFNRYKIGEIFKYIYTATSTARYDCRCNNTFWDFKAWLEFNNYTKAMNEKQLLLWYECFLGGLVISNPNYCMQIMEEVASFDFVSSYIYSMYKDFPIIFREKIINFDYFNDYITAPGFNKIKFFNAILRLKNLKLSKFNLPVLSVHKLIFNSSHHNQINGKLIYASDITITLTSTDFEIYSNFYDFEISEIIYFEENAQITKLPKYVLNNLERLLKAKSEQKEYYKQIKNAHKFQKYDFADKEISAIINSKTNYIDQLNAMDDIYSETKAQLNAQFGTNVQKPLNDNLEYDFEKGEFVAHTDSFERYYFRRNKKTNLIVGTYICAFSRYNLARILISMLHNDVKVLYCDTDSIKCVYDAKSKPIIDKIVGAWNDHVGNTLYGIGKFDYEETYEKFCTNGNKSYIALEEGIISATISGLPRANKIYNELYKKNKFNFEKLINNAYSFNTVLDSTVTDKLTHHYAKDNEFDVLEKSLIHVKYANYEDYVYSGITFEKCDLTLKSIENSMTQFNNAVTLLRYFNFDYKKLIYKNIIFTKNGTYYNKKTVLDEKFIKLFEGVYNESI